jgi:hypothetical protein
MIKGFKQIFKKSKILGILSILTAGIVGFYSLFFVLAYLLCRLVWKFKIPRALKITILALPLLITIPTAIMWTGILLGIVQPQNATAQKPITTLSSSVITSVSAYKSSSSLLISSVSQIVSSVESSVISSSNSVSISSLKEEIKVTEEPIIEDIYNQGQKIDVSNQNFIIPKETTEPRISNANNQPNIEKQTKQTIQPEIKTTIQTPTQTKIVEPTKPKPTEITQPIVSQTPPKEIITAPVQNIQPTYIPTPNIIATSNKLTCKDIGRRVYIGDPDYLPKFDKDGDGIGCEAY